MPLRALKPDEIHLSEIADALEYYSEFSESQIVRQVGRRVRRQVQGCDCSLTRSKNASFT